MHGDLAKKLVQHAKRVQSLPSQPLPPYQTELVRALTREVHDLDTEITALLAPFQFQDQPFDPSSDRATATRLLIAHLSMRRNKRCLLAYHRVRAERLEALSWSGTDDQHHQGSLSPEEEEYYKQYTDLLSAHKGQWTDIDLTGSVEPPRELFVDVRVLKDAGEMVTEFGVLQLTKNSQFYVRLADVERLIAMGVVQRMS